ncbi:MAG: hypothetical protein D4R67_04460 [Bacteroidetes bacterium]|nr:MAG: hypothetical protein D4R67_04460 [Bacteroidota bacterium]
MKKIIFLLGALLFTGGVVTAQKLTVDKVPAQVRQAFMKKFPKVYKYTWEMEDSNYEVTFKLDGKEASANFDSAGNWLESETEISQSELPNAVLDGIKRDFPGFKTEEVVKGETPDKGAFYEVHLEKGEQEYKASYAESGTLINKKLITEEAEEND